MIDGVDIISVGYEITWLGTLVGVLMVFGFLICAVEVVVFLKECRGDIALALVIVCAVLVVAFNPIAERFTYEKIHGQGLRLRNSIGTDKGLRDNGAEQRLHIGHKGETK